MDIIIIILLILTTCILSALHFYYNFTFWKRNGVPYLEPMLLYGYMKSIMKKEINMADFTINIYNDLKKQTNKFAGIYMVSHQVVFPIDPEIIKCVLATDFQVFHDRGLYCDEHIDPLSGTIVNLSGKKWEHLRAKFSPTFTPAKMKMMFQTLFHCNTELGKFLDERAAKNEPLDIYDIMVRLTIDYIGSCAFGIDCNSVKDPNAEFRHYGKLVIESTFNEAIWHIIGSTVPSFMKMFRIPMNNKEVSKFFMDTMHETVDNREKNKVRRNDFIDLFLKLKNNKSVAEEGKKIGESITFNELAAQAFAMFVGGFESTGTTLSYCLYEMCVNLKIQDNLREEIVTALNDENEITYDAIMKMTYMDQVISETLRKYPPVPMTTRIANSDYQIPDSHVTIKKDTICWISITGLHRDPEHYPDPDYFDPERFSEENIAKRHPYTYIPFGSGPRKCIGMKFGLMQIKIALTSLLSNYKFTLNSKTILPITFTPGGIMASPENPIWLNCSRLDNNLRKDML